MQKNSNSPLSILDLLRPEYTQNPYPLYSQLREQDPIYWDKRFQGWVLTRHADVVTVLRDPRFTANRAFKNTSWIPNECLASISPTMHALSRQMLFLDQPDHTRLRSLVSGAFTPRVVENMRLSIQREADALLDTIIPQGHMEVITDFASPLASNVIATLLSIPTADHSRFVKWSDDFGLLIDGIKTAEDMIYLLQSLSEFIEYFRESIKRHKCIQHDDLMQTMITAKEQESRLNEDELLGNLVLLLAAGHITTTHLISNGLFALLRNPAAFQQLKENPDLISSAVTELLRYDSPTQSTERLPLTDLEMSGKQLKRGQSVLLCLGAANHDPAQFRNPDQLNLNRPENRHVAFGHGIHFCLGASLGRLEAEIAFNTLLQRLDQPQILCEKPEHVASLAFRNLKKLPITFN